MSLRNVYSDRPMAWTRMSPRTVSTFWLLEASMAEMSGADAIHVKEDPDKWRQAGLAIRARERKRAALKT